MDFPEDLRYTEEHEWLRRQGEVARVGVTAFAAGEMGDVVFVELPEIGTRLEKGKPFGVVESVKSVSDLFAPVSGEVVARNDALLDEPEAVNSDPYGEGWMVELRLADAAQLDDLLDAAAYAEKVQ